jgi:hypothetical protein
VTLLALAAPVLADVEDRDPVPPQTRSVATGIMGQGGRYLGRAAGAWGPFIEVAAGRGRFQYFAELAGMRITTGEDADQRRGMLLRGGAGVRWLARSFQLDERFSLDMNLEAFAGLGQLRWEQGERVLRPDLGVGVGYQVRKLAGWKLAMRVSARAYFAPHDHSAVPVSCRSSTPCSMAAAPSSSSGLMALFGFAW